MSEEYKLSEKGLQYAKRLLKEKKEVRDFFFGLVTNDVIKFMKENSADPVKMTNDVIKFMKENSADPVKIILKILETDLKLREDGLDWEEFLLRLKKTDEGYVVEGG